MKRTTTMNLNLALNMEKFKSVMYKHVTVSHRE